MKTQDIYSIEISTCRSKEEIATFLRAIASAIEAGRECGDWKDTVEGEYSNLSAEWHINKEN